MLDGVTVLATVTYDEIERRAYDIYGDVSNIPDYQTHVRFDDVRLTENGVMQKIRFGDLDAQTRVSMIQAAKLQGRVLCQKKIDAILERRN